MRDLWLAIKLGLVYVLNLADYFLTARMIESGLVREVNPVMLRLFYWGPEYVFLLKILSGMLFASYMWNLRKKRPRLVQILTTAVLVFFVFLVSYLHITLTYVRVIERLF